MSQDEAISRKDKKALRDADRRKKGKKRKHEEIAQDGHDEEQNEFDKDFLPLDSGATQKTTGEHKHKSKKSSSKKRKAEEVAESALSDQQNGDAQSTKPQKKRKTKHDDVENGVPTLDGDIKVTSTKLKKQKQKKAKQGGLEIDTHEEDSASTKPQKRKKTAQDGVEDDTLKEATMSSEKAHRFILFVGNLPYAATEATLRSHFKKLEPFTVRHRTDPKTEKSKGFAFLEFENYDRMKTCLKLYHHSMFDPDKVDAVVSEEGEADQENDGQKTKKASKRARRINVELTAGGGGKAESRKEKIRVKNERLGEQRQRRAEAEKKEREKKAKEDGETNAAKPTKKAKKSEEVEKNEKVEPKSEAGGMMDVHPSRLARITA